MCHISLTGGDDGVSGLFGFHGGNLVLFQRARAASLAIWLRRSGVSLLALAVPPFRPPSFPRATAAGSLIGLLSVSL